MRRLPLVLGTVAALFATVHYGYKALTGECPCDLRRAMQWKFALLLLKGLEREGYLAFEPCEDCED